MLFKHRPRTALIAGLAVIMAIPVPAFAKPTSSYVVEMTVTGAGVAGSVEIAFDDLGVSHFGLSHTEFEIITCASGQGTRTTSWVAGGPVGSSFLDVTRKLDELAVTGSVEVSKTQSTHCPETGTLVQSTTTTDTFELQGVSSERVRRSRLNGDRVLSSTLDPLTFTLSELSMTGVGMLTETISK